MHDVKNATMPEIKVGSSSAPVTSDPRLCSILTCLTLAQLHIKPHPFSVLYAFNGVPLFLSNVNLCILHMYMTIVYTKCNHSCNMSASCITNERQLECYI